MKYLLGLPGLAFMYVQSSAEGIDDPKLTGWFGRKQPFSINPHIIDYPEHATHYETGTPSIPSIFAANAGMDLINIVGVEHIKKYIKILIDYLATQLAYQGEQLFCYSKEESHGAHIAIRDSNAGKLAKFLQSMGAIVSPRGDLARLSLK